MRELTIFGFDIPATIYVPVLYLVWVTAFLLLKKIFFGAVRRFATRTATKFDDVFLNSLDFPLLLIIFASGAFVLDNIFEFRTGGELLQFVDVAFKATAIIAIILFFDRLITGLIDTYAQKIPVLRDSKGVMHVVIRSIVIGLGLLILLDNFGVSITPILASLGIGSLAITFMKAFYEFVFY